VLVVTYSVSSTALQPDLGKRHNPLSSGASPTPPLQGPQISRLQQENPPQNLQQQQGNLLSAPTISESQLLFSPTRSRRAPSDTCVDFTVDGWFKDRVPQTGLPSSLFVARPPSISQCELAQLHRDCVDRINLYRLGALKFSDGAQDSNVQAVLEPLAETTGNNQCSSEAAMGDLQYNVEHGGGCAGMHQNVFSCDWQRRATRTSCCARGPAAAPSASLDSYAAVRDELL